MADTPPPQTPDPNPTQYWCNNGFPESTSQDSLFDNHLLNVLRILADTARQNNPPPSQPPDPVASNNNNNNNENQNHISNDNSSVTSALRHTLILDWAEILMGSYVGDYVDEDGYESVLDNLGESDNGGRRGAPPASKRVMEGLEIVVIKTEDEVVLCSVCKDLVNVGELGKRLPCGHLYHGGCIVPWLGVRNSCPVCRFELATDDREYEEERKRRVECGNSSVHPSSG